MRGRTRIRRHDDMSDLSEAKILDALRGVTDPERGGDIVSRGVLSGVRIRDGHVGFAVEVEPERGPRLDPLRKAAEKAVEALDGVLSVSAVLTAERAGKAPPRQAAPHGH